MSTNRIRVLGAGGHGKAVIGAAQFAGYLVEAVYDDDATKWGQAVLGVTISGPIESVMQDAKLPTIAAVADPLTRMRLVASLDLPWATLVHPRAYVHPAARISIGVVAFAGVIVQPDVEIGEHAILNANATVAHDCIVGRFAHLAPGADLAGGVHVGEGTLIGTGAATTPNVRIGAWCLVGAGATVVRDLPDRVVAVGTPARVTRHLST